MTLLETLNQYKDDAFRLQDYYFDKWQRTGSELDHEEYLRYKGQEEAYFISLEILELENRKGK